MATIRRKIEVHKLTISGLPEGTAYGSLLKNLRGRTRPVAEMVRRNGEKSHALNDATLRNHRLRLRFFSYTKGHRPEVLDTEDFAITGNPLAQSQTFLEWTHVLGGKVGERYLLLVERNHAGIWPSALERYLQWTVDEFHTSDPSAEDGDLPPVTISLEAEPGPEFMDRVAALDRVTEATVRIVRPNPGWQDLASELGGVADQSDAHKADVTMRARRGESLDRQSGILAWMSNRFLNHTLDFAAVSGKKGRQTDSFNTQHLGKHGFFEIEADGNGQIVAENAWEKLSEMMDGLE